MCKCKLKWIALSILAGVTFFIHSADAQTTRFLAPTPSLAAQIAGIANRQSEVIDAERMIVTNDQHRMDNTMDREELRQARINLYRQRELNYQQHLLDMARVRLERAWIDLENQRAATAYSNGSYGCGYYGGRRYINVGVVR